MSLGGLCPACGTGKAFDGVLSIADECKHCHLSFEGHDLADGPSFMVMMILCLLLAFGAALLELLVSPPLWWHAVLWPTITVVLSVPMLRFFRALMLVHAYKVKPESFEYMEGNH